MIGVPVYNGSNYLRCALDSILAQTYPHWHVIIADNASTDETPTICTEYAAKDPRIEVIRHRQNLGAAPNFNSVFRPGNAPYFKWAAHDDTIEPRYLEACVELLDADPSVVLAHSPSLNIDSQGNQVGDYDEDLMFDGELPSQRLWRVLWTHHFTDIFGVFRSSVLAKSGLMGSYVGADRNLVAEVVLHGNVAYAKEYLFSRRTHTESYMAALETQQSQMEWFNPNVRVPDWQMSFTKFKEYATAIKHAPLGRMDRLALSGTVAKWALYRGIESVTGSDRFRQGVLRTCRTHGDLAHATRR